MSHFEPLTDQQLLDVCNLRQSSQQAEDALSQGMDKLQQTLAQSIVTDPVSSGNYRSQMAEAVEKLDALESFVNQVIPYSIYLSILQGVFFSHSMFFWPLLYSYVWLLM